MIYDLPHNQLVFVLWLLQISQICYNSAPPHPQPPKKPSQQPTSYVNNSRFKQFNLEITNC